MKTIEAERRKFHRIIFTISTLLAISILIGIVISKQHFSDAWDVWTTGVFFGITLAIFILYYLNRRNRRKIFYIRE